MLKKDVNKYSNTINFLDYFTKKCENTKKRYDNIININIELTNLLNKKIDNLEMINKSWTKTDSLRKIQLMYCDSIIKDRNRSIEDLNKSLRRKQNIIKYGSAGSCILIILCLLLK